MEGETRWEERGEVEEEGGERRGRGREEGWGEEGGERRGRGREEGWGEERGGEEKEEEKREGG